MKLENKLIPEDERLSSLEAQPGYLAKDMDDDDKSESGLLAEDDE